MTMMIITAGSGGPSGPAGASDGAGSDSSAGNTFAGVLAGIPESEGRPAGRSVSTGRTSPEDRTGKQGNESDAELAAMAALTLLVPAVPAAALVVQGTLGSSAALTTTAEPTTASPTTAVAKTASAMSVEANTASVTTARVFTDIANTETASTETASTETASTEIASTAEANVSPGRASQQPDSAVSQLPAAGIDPAPSPRAVGLPVPAETLRAGPTGGPAEGKNAAGQSGPGQGLGLVNALGSANAADAAQVAAALNILRSTGTTETLATTGTSKGSAPANAPLPASAKLPGSEGPPASAKLVAGAGLSRSAGGATAISHRPAKFAAGAGAGAADDHAAEPLPPTGQVPAAVSTEPVPAAAQPAMTALPPAQPVLAGHQVPITVGRHSADQPYPQPSNLAETPVARQVAAPLLSLRAGGDGSHQLIVALHPAELGPVNVHVRIEGDLMTIQLASTSETAHDTLRDALPQLRTELQSAGLGTVALSLDLASGGQPGSGAFADPRQAGGNPSRSSRAAPVSDPVPAHPRHRTTADRISTSASSGLDRWL